MLQLNTIGILYLQKLTVGNYAIIIYHLLISNLTTKVKAKFVLVLN
jgi:hypothetical protein